MSEAGHLAFGRPIDGIIQFAYTVEDIDRAMPIYTDLLGVGPWFKRGPVVAETARFRGEPTELQLTLARGFTGHSMVELIEMNPGQERHYTSFHAASPAWDGGDPVRIG